MDLKKEVQGITKIIIIIKQTNKQTNKPTTTKNIYQLKTQKTSSRIEMLLEHKCVEYQYIEQYCLETFPIIPFKMIVWYHGWILMNNNQLVNQSSGVECVACYLMI